MTSVYYLSKPTYTTTTLIEATMAGQHITLSDERYTQIFKILYSYQERMMKPMLPEELESSSRKIEYPRKKSTPFAIVCLLQLRSNAVQNSSRCFSLWKVKAITKLSRASLPIFAQGLIRTMNFTSRTATTMLAFDLLGLI
jgi:hypothetical protein